MQSSVLWSNYLMRNSLAFPFRIFLSSSDIVPPKQLLHQTEKRGMNLRSGNPGAGCRPTRPPGPLPLSKRPVSRDRVPGASAAPARRDRPRRGSFSSLLSSGCRDPTASCCPGHGLITLLYKAVTRKGVKPAAERAQNHSAALPGAAHLCASARS